MVNLYRRKKKVLKNAYGLNPKRSKNRRIVESIVQLELDLSKYQKDINCIDALRESLLEEREQLKTIF